jgi:hypothetical protein
VVPARFDIRIQDHDGCGFYGPASITDSKGVTGGLPIITNGTDAYFREGNVTVVKVDLTKPFEYDGDENLADNPKAAPGRIVIKSGGLSESGKECENVITYTYQPTASAQSNQAAVAKSSTPTPTPSPSVTPVMATPTPEAASGQGVNPTTALILGALLGAALLSLAEVSALEYRKKHGRAGDIAKRNKK